MTATITNIAEAVVTALTAATFSQPITSVNRTYMPDYDQVKVEGIQLYVLAADVGTPTQETRADSRYNYRINISIVKEVSQVSPEVTTSEMDEMTAFTEEVMDHFQNNRVTTGVDMTGISNTPAYDPAMLFTHGLFVSVLSLTITAVR